MYENSLWFFVALICGCLAPWSILQAAEGGGEVYLLGLRGSGAGLTPPLGVFFSIQIDTYSGSLVVDLWPAVSDLGAECWRRRWMLISLSVCP